MGRESDIVEGVVIGAILSSQLLQPIANLVDASSSMGRLGWRYYENSKNLVLNAKNPMSIELRDAVVKVAEVDDKGEGFLSVTAFDDYWGEITLSYLKDRCGILEEIAIASPPWEEKKGYQKVVKVNDSGCIGR